jgi:hypothetical protein
MFHLLFTTEQSRAACWTLLIYICFRYSSRRLEEREEEASILVESVSQSESVKIIVTGVVIAEPDHRP